LGEARSAASDDDSEVADPSEGRAASLPPSVTNGAMPGTTDKTQPAASPHAAPAAIVADEDVIVMGSEAGPDGEQAEVARYAVMDVHLLCCYMVATFMFF